MTSLFYLSPSNTLWFKLVVEKYYLTIEDPSLLESWNLLLTFYLKGKNILTSNRLNWLHLLEIFMTLYNLFTSSYLGCCAWVSTLYLSSHSFSFRAASSWPFLYLFLFKKPCTWWFYLFYTIFYLFSIVIRLKAWPLFLSPKKWP